MNSAVITLEDEDGERINHARCDPGGNYATLCGCSDDDTEFREVDSPKNARIECPGCWQTWKAARSIRFSDFCLSFRKSEL